MQRYIAFKIVTKDCGYTVMISASTHQLTVVFGSVMHKRSEFFTEYERRIVGGSQRKMDRMHMFTCPEQVSWDVPY